MREIGPSNIGSPYLSRRRGGEFIVTVESEVDEGGGRHVGSEVREKILALAHFHLHKSSRVQMVKW